MSRLTVAAERSRHGLYGRPIRSTNRPTPARPSRSSRARPAATTTTTSGSARSTPNHMITASDQGTVVTVDGGAHWSDWYNQPTGQFYHLAADNRFPYWIYSGQQDSGTVGIASRSDYGAISFRDWHPGRRRRARLRHPRSRRSRTSSTDPALARASRAGTRARAKCRTSRRGRCPHTASGRPNQIPLHVDLADRVLRARAVRALRGHANAVPLERQRPALGHHQSRPHRQAGRREALRRRRADANATACGYGVIYSIAPSPRSNDEIWIGTDNGRIQMTADGGKNWSDVTPKSIPAWSRIDSLDLSALDPGTAYAAVDNHRQDDFHPIAVRTHDNGKTWTKITNGLPDGHFVAVVRADPVQQRLALRRHRRRRLRLLRRRRRTGNRCNATCPSPGCATCSSTATTSSPRRKAARSGCSTT